MSNICLFWSRLHNIISNKYGSSGKSILNRSAVTLLLLAALMLLSTVTAYSYEHFYGCVTKQDYLQRMLEGRSNLIIHYTVKNVLVKYHPIDDAIAGCGKTLWIKRGMIDTAKCMKSINMLWKGYSNPFLNTDGLSRREFFEAFANGSGTGRQGSMSGTRMKVSTKE